MGVLRDRRVAVLLALVLVGSALSIVLALTRPEPSRAGAPPEVVGTDGPAFRPADLVGPGGDALDAAVRGIPLTLDFDHRSLDASLRAATAVMTRDYAAVFTRSFNRQVRPFAERRQAVSEGVVRGGGVVRATDDLAVCLLYVDQVLVEARGQRPNAAPQVLARNRVRVELRLVDGSWRISGIRVV